MSRGLAPATLLALIVASPVAHAQVNIDQDKTPAHIFASDCSVCHKSTRGLANGRGSSALAGFLVEHYTSSREEAAAMATYVLGAGGSLGSPTPARDQNPAAGRASAQEPKSGDARRSAKPKQEPDETAKPKRAAGERGKPPRERRNVTAEPGRSGAEPKPDGEGREPAAAATAHGQSKPESAPANAQPATVATEAKPAEAAKPEVRPAAPAAASSQDALPSAASPAATDNIPD